MPFRKAPFGAGVYTTPSFAIKMFELPNSATAPGVIARGRSARAFDHRLRSETFGMTGGLDETRIDQEVFPSAQSEEAKPGFHAGPLR
jgi:hypothetical protein